MLNKFLLISFATFFSTAYASTNDNQLKEIQEKEKTSCFILVNEELRGPLCSESSKTIVKNSGFYEITKGDKLFIGSICKNTKIETQSFVSFNLLSSQFPSHKPIKISSDCILSNMYSDLELTITVHTPFSIASERVCDVTLNEYNRYLQIQDERAQQNFLRDLLKKSDSIILSNDYYRTPILIETKAIKKHQGYQISPPTLKDLCQFTIMKNQKILETMPVLKNPNEKNETETLYEKPSIKLQTLTYLMKAGKFPYLELFFIEKEDTIEKENK